MSITDAKTASALRDPIRSSYSLVYAELRFLSELVTLAGRSSNARRVRSYATHLSQRCSEPDNLLMRGNGMKMQRDSSGKESA